MRLFEKVGRFFKVHGGVAYGFAFVSTINGVPYFDLGDGEFSDHIPVDSIEKVSALFMDESRVGLDMHKGEQVADVLYALPMIDDVLAGNGVTSQKQGLMIGWRCPDPELLAKIASGERTGFSIGGLVSAYDIVDDDGNIVESVELTDKSAQTFGAGLVIGKRDAAIAKGMRRRVFRAWKLKEISLVDFPMQEPALVGAVHKRGKTYTKTKTIMRVVEKGAMFTSIVDGHQHVIDTREMRDGVGTTSWETSESSTSGGHSHSFLIDGAGKIVLTTTEGHTHAIEVVGADSSTETVNRGTGVQVVGAKNLPSVAQIPTVGNMDPKDKAIADLTAETTALKAEQTALKRMATLTDAQRAYFGKLSADDQSAFLAKSAALRDAEIKSALDADPVIYTSKSTGKTYRTSQADLAEMAKMLDESNARAEKAAKGERQARFGKMASEKMGNLKGKASLHARMLEALEKGLVTDKGEPDEAAFAEAVEVLDAANATNGDNFEDPGQTSEVPDDDETTTTDPVEPKKGGQAATLQAQVDKMRDEYALKNSIKPQQAVNRLLKSSTKFADLYKRLAAEGEKSRQSSRPRT